MEDLKFLFIAKKNGQRLLKDWVVLLNRLMLLKTEIVFLIFFLQVIWQFASLELTIGHFAETKYIIDVSRELNAKIVLSTPFQMINITNYVYEHGIDDLNHFMKTSSIVILRACLEIM